MPFHPTLTDKIFQLPPSGIETKEDEEALNAYLTNLYGESPVYDYHYPLKTTETLDSQSYYQQICRLLKEIIELARILDIKPGDINLLEKHLTTWQTTYHPYHNEPVKFYNEIKRLFERSLFLLKNTHSHNHNKAREELKQLCRQVEKCPTGVYGALESIQEQLISSRTLAHYLESSRNEIIEHQASTFFYRYKLNRLAQGANEEDIDRLSAHVIKLFHKISFELGFTTFKGEAHQNELDAYQSTLGINRKTIRKLSAKLIKRYTPDYIVRAIYDRIQVHLAHLRNREFYAQGDTALALELTTLFAPFIRSKIISESDLLEEKKGRYFLKSTISDYLKGWIHEALTVQGFFTDHALAPVRRFCDQTLTPSQKTPLKSLALTLKLIGELRQPSRVEKVQLTYQAIQTKLNQEISAQSPIRRWFKRSIRWLSFLFKTTSEKQLEALSFAITQNTDKNYLSETKLNSTSKTHQNSLFQMQQLTDVNQEIFSGITLTRFKRFKDHCNKGRISNDNGLFVFPSQYLIELVKLDDEFFDTKFTRIFSYFKYEQLEKQVSALNAFIQSCQSTVEKHHQIQQALTYLNQGGDIRYLNDYKAIPTELCLENDFIKQLTQERAAGKISESDIARLINDWKQAKECHMATAPLITAFFSSLTAKCAEEETSQAYCPI